MDVFLIAGQSNSEGHGESGGPPVPDGMAFAYFNGALTSGNDPVGNANPGSAWPAFMRTYVERTSRRVTVVPAAIGGTGQCSKVVASHGSWDDDGELWARSVGLLREAVAKLRESGADPAFRGILWSQGEADSYGILHGNETAADYEAALMRMIVRYRNVPFIGPAMPFYIFRTGANSAGAGDFFAPVRDAQERVAARDAQTIIVFRGAADFPARGMMRSGEHALHYNQAGLDLMGREGAEWVIAALA
jgi:hypothetical protein